MIALENVSLRFGQQAILNSVSFSTDEGKIIGLLGPNGAGKSSIIKILAGLIRPDDGIVYLNGKATAFDKLKNSCGFLIDSPAFYPYLSAEENLRILKRINKANVDLKDSLRMVGLQDAGRKKVKHFSSGMKQRLALAMAIMRSPKCLILDEPFNGLDPTGFQDVTDMLNDLNAGGTTIFVSSHLLKDLEEFAHSFILIHNGRVVLDVSREELQESKKRVTFTFGKPSHVEIQAIIQKYDDSVVKDNKVVMHLHPQEIAEVVNSFVACNNTPVNIETHTILQEKYFELAN